MENSKIVKDSFLSTYSICLNKSENENLVEALPVSGLYKANFVFSSLKKSPPQGGK